MVENDLSSSMQTQIVITNSNSQGPSQSTMGNNGQVLVRSKSLDDLNTLICYSNLWASSTMENNNLSIPNPITGQQAGAHYASFNRIFSDFTKLNITPVESSNPDCTSPQLLNYSSSGQASHQQHQQTPQQLLLPDQTLNSTINNVKVMSFSSREISNAGSNQAQSFVNSASNASLCDIDNVMKKISSLRV